MNVQAQRKADIETKMNEAEVYRSMGLNIEAMAIYEQILTDFPELETQKQKNIEQRIAGLRKTIDEQERRDTQNVSAEDISKFKKTLSSDDSVTTILDGASAFKDLGLYTEAVAEYEKLFSMDYPPEKIIPEFVTCLFKIHSPSEVSQKAMRIAGIDKLAKNVQGLIKFRFGVEMEKRDHKDLALELYKSAKGDDPENKELKEKLSALLAGLSSGSRYDYLLNQSLATTEQLQKALSQSKKIKKSVEWILIHQQKIPAEEVGKSLSYFYGCPFRSFDSGIPTPVELIGNLKKSFLLHDLWVPLTWNKNGVEILIDDPRNLDKTDHIRALVKTKKINFSVAIREDIEAFIKQFFDENRVKEAHGAQTDASAYDLIPDVSFEEEEEIEEDEPQLDEASGQVVKLVDQVLIAAYRKGASDIHFEPSPITKATSIRFRIDGVCQDYVSVPNSMSRGILSRLKVMARLDIAERRLPQDGKIKFKRRGVTPFELRLATMPTTGNLEDAVLRILATAGAMKLDEMGLGERNLRVLKRTITRPYGLVLVVGPTGSGKTTTLHSALGEINKPGIKIWTAEDPVEITQTGLRQVEAKPQIGLDFPRIMRSFLRADPDVIMIGEMRDEETAAIGIEASLTGHLVLSTLHTNSAPETVTRLLDMGLNPLNFSDAFLGVLAQRLVRRLCKSCRKSYHPEKEEFQEITSEYGQEHFGATGIKYTRDLKLYEPVGCEECSGTGYRGRLGVHELMEGTESVKRLIRKQADTGALFDQAMKEGMRTLKQDGILKAFEGITDIAEVRRVCIN
jgi:type II secretory ATPase GspE/PulE/Tfp pilus assembly ATPase PilB-like protein